MKLELDKYYLEFDNYYRTLTLYENIEGQKFPEDLGFIIVEENKADEIKNFLIVNVVNSDINSVISNFATLLPLEGNFAKIVSILQRHFSPEPAVPHVLTNETQIKADATKELYNAFLVGNLENCQSILDQNITIGLKPDHGCLAAAIKSGNVVAVIYLKDNFNIEPKDSSSLMYAIETAKSLEMIQYLITYSRLKYEAMTRNDLSWAAARTGDLGILKYCVEKLRCPTDSGTLYDAVRSGNIKLVQYLVEERKFTDIAEALDFARIRNLVDISDYLSNIDPRNGKSDGTLQDTKVSSFPFWNSVDSRQARGNIQDLKMELQITYSLLHERGLHVLQILLDPEEAVKPEIKAILSEKGVPYLEHRGVIFPFQVKETLGIFPIKDNKYSKKNVDSIEKFFNSIGLIQVCDLWLQNDKTYDGLLSVGLNMVNDISAHQAVLYRKGLASL